MAGQVILYSHQHNYKTDIISPFSHSSKTTISEHCQLCDAMHFNQMMLMHQVYFEPANSYLFIFVSSTYNFKSISLILASGRAPPIS
jgi:hypothetical protein